MKLGVRSAGVLLHVTSLPEGHGIGDLGPQAHAFVETLREARQSWWQMLPIAPPGFGHSPYAAISAFAGNPLLLSLDFLERDGLLSSADLRSPVFPIGRVDFRAAERFKRPLLWKAFEAWAPGREFAAFCRRNAGWLEDYALFAALRDQRSGAPWTHWEPDLRDRKPAALQEARGALDARIRFHRFLQFQFHRQWRELRKRANRRGVGLIGDLPLFVAHDSADVWAHRGLFWLDGQGQPLKVAGVPPDYFSKTGQLWGNPLYRWDAMRRRGFSWWIERLRSSLERFDAVRLDHFIGFYNYWEIPGGSTTAERGRWVKAPGAALFARAQRALGRMPLIAEDLGVVNQGVRDLRDRFGFPGLRVLQMAFGTDPDADLYKTHNHPRNCVAYTGTHDNDTTSGWFNDKSTATSTRTPEEIERERTAVLRYLGTDGRQIHMDMTRFAFLSAADIAIVPAQDLLGLGSEARMNRPGTVEGNWTWRLKDALPDKVRRSWAEMTETYGRASGSGS